MANGITTPATPSTAGGSDVSGYRKQLQKAAARTREVQTVAPETSKLLQESAASLEPRKGSALGPGLQKTGEALVSQVGRQEKDLQSRAERAASALEMTGESTLAGVQKIEEIQSSLRTGVASAAGAWDAAAEKADEYVQAARGRVAEVLTKLDELSEEMGRTRDFAKAHAMQSAVQAVTGSMKAEERNIVQTYGTDSKEYEQFRQSKSRALAVVQSNIHSTYAQLEEQQKSNLLNVTTDAHVKSNMYIGFQEQQHVEMLKFRDNSRNAYNLRTAELDATLEQMKMAGMENLANWILETPTFSMDVTPTITALADLQVTQENLEREGMLSGQQARLMGQQANIIDYNLGQSAAGRSILNKAGPSGASSRRRGLR